jgi:hypothetical protein
MSTPTPTPAPVTKPAAPNIEHDAENFISRIHVNGWLFLAAVIGANLVGVFLHV